MPCYDPRAEQDWSAERFARMESILCSACRALERMGYDFGENPLLDEWWVAHKAQDARK